MLVVRGVRTGRAPQGDDAGSVLAALLERGDVMGIPKDSAIGKRIAALVDGKTPRKRPPAKTISAGWVLVLELPLVVVSESNLREYWAVKHRRNKAQQGAVLAVIHQMGLSAWRPPLPVTVTLTRQGSRLLDSGNLESSFKHVQDAVASWMQVDDGDRGSVSWEYEQCLGLSGTFARIEPRRR